MTDDTMKFCEKSCISFQNWYPKFRAEALKSLFIPIPDEVLTFLRSDGVLIPTEATRKVASSSPDDQYYTGSIEWDSSGEDEDEILPPSFPHFSQELQKALDDLGGSVFLKTNWSSPSDAMWIISNNSLECTNLQDIYLLLKGSNKVAKDLSTDYKLHGEHMYYVVLKQWKDIHPGTEFRCFVHSDELVGISQRSKSDYFSYIEDNGTAIVDSVQRFYNNKVKNKLGMSNFVFDIVRTHRGTIKIVDFGLWRATDPLLFSWEYLEGVEIDEGFAPKLVFIGEDVGVQPGDLEGFGMPSDLRQANGDEVRNIMEMLQKQYEAQEREDRDGGNSSSS